uniref:SFRICE_013418 n=1 Tax=Spodoptera frugiperda TaxID=7108 RepID=A0A2H1V510_SPOFR
MFFYIFLKISIIEVDVAPKVGNSAQWHEYRKSYLYPINKILKECKEEPLRSIRNVYNKTFKLTTVWDNWSECKEIDHQRGVRKRLGRCRLQPNTIKNNYDYNFGLKPVETFGKKAKSILSDGYDIACRSIELNKTVPKLSEIIRNIPEFEEEEACNFTRGSAKHKVTKSKNKNKTMKQVEENGHVTLTCTEASPNSELKWFKDTKLLNSLFRNKKCKNEEESSHISVDTNNSLHILHITKKEEGNYSCQSDDKKVQEFEIKVVSKSKLLNQGDLLTHSNVTPFILRRDLLSIKGMAGFCQLFISYVTVLAFLAIC